jgi:quinol monooxygenase YgiN
MIGKLVAHPGRRDEFVAGIRELKDADGCDRYVVSREVEDRNTIWVVEAWRDDAAHCAALGHARGPCGDRARDTAYR